MGTNFYLMCKNKFSIKRNFKEEEYDIVDEPYLGYEVHLCKRSCGWKPLFEVHTKFKTFKELEKFFIENERDYEIFDEYGTPYSFRDFKQAMIDHANLPPEPCKWEYSVDAISKLQGDNRKTLNLVSCNEGEEPDIYIPFDHMEYQKSYNKAMREYNYHIPWSIGTAEFDYTRDPDYNFDWTERSFS